MKEQKHSVYIDELGIKISTGSLAKFANGSVTIQSGETIVFVSATASDKLKPDQDYFPLMVDYREKYAAAGRFPGGYFKREGRPTEKETLTSRLCDRPLRPLFSKGFMNEVQIIGMLLSSDSTNEPDVLMVNAASAALMVSDIPFHGPIGCVRVGEVNGAFVVNPTNEQLFESRLDLIYVGNERDMMMIEGSADQLPEERLIEALEFAHKQIQPILRAQKELALAVNKKKLEFDLVEVEPIYLELCKKKMGNRLEDAIYKESKHERYKGITTLKEELSEAIKTEMGEDKYDNVHFKLAFDQLQEEIYRHHILHADRRADGRNIKEVRKLHCETDVLPRVHGSALFSRGETQALVIATLGTSKDAQELDALTGGAQSKSFILHYNFPPFSVGETGRYGAASRREIGHGALAERSLLPIVPPEDAFAYSIRLVSDIFESNGSSSMASVCGGCLALMDAGVPIIAPVAGMSAGLVTETDSDGTITNYKILTDILGDEDHFGDMDFKIAGSAEGVTGFQLDLKITGLPIEIAKKAIMQNRDGRMIVLQKMKEALAGPRPDLKEHTPRIHRMMIDPEKIGALIGPGGKNIKKIIEITGAQIDINEDNSGEVLVFSSDKEALQRAIAEINLVVAEIEIGMTYKGKVRSVKEYGVFVECLPGKEGLVHVSELAEVPVENVEDLFKVGDEIVVKCVGTDERGRTRLSRKAALYEAKGIPYELSTAPRSNSGGFGRSDRGRRGSGRNGERSGGRSHAGSRLRRED